MSTSAAATPKVNMLPLPTLPPQTPLPVAPAAAVVAPSTCISYNTKDINVSALPAAMSEYEKILVNRLTKPLMSFFEKLYKEQIQKLVAFTSKQAPTAAGVMTPKHDPMLASALKQAGNNADLIMFQHVLNSVPDWLATQLDPVVTEILNQTQQMGDQVLLETLKIMFISKAVLMASIKPGTASSNACINLDLPTLSLYIHRILMLAAKELKRFPSLLKQFKVDTEITLTKKRATFRKIVKDAISEAIHDMFPFDHVVSNYLMSKPDIEPSEPLPPLVLPEAEVMVAPEPIIAALAPQVQQPTPKPEIPAIVEEPAKEETVAVVPETVAAETPKVSVAAELGLKETADEEKPEEEEESEDSDSASETEESDASSAESETSDEEEVEKTKKKKHHSSKSKKHHKKTKKHQHHKHKKTSQIKQ
jgi:hypothetical protein